MQERQEKWIRYLSWMAAAVIALMMGLSLLWQGREHRLALGILQTPGPTPAPTGAPRELSVTPVPAAVNVEIRGDYPPEAVDLVADGRVLFTLPSRQAAREVLEQYLNTVAAQELGANESLMRASFEQTLVLTAPEGKGELLSQEAALSTLLVDQTILPVSRRVNRCDILSQAPETTVTEAPLLPLGSRLYRTYAHSGHTLVYSEILYRGQAAYTQDSMGEHPFGPGTIPLTVEEGTYILEEASAEAGPQVPAPEGFSPLWPVKGQVVGHFGMEGYTLCYGVTLDAEGNQRAMAPEGGVIIYCGQRGNMGLVVDILHDDGRCISRIIGLERLDVELYQRIGRGEPLGSTAPGSSPVTYALTIDGYPVNPEHYLP
ncbi:MAG: M23 family metallopeptidase [Clostridia bacterium]|nr:M23 family metallopeptidase [Clostridia bacterium]